jgi:hypothetical protein
MESEPVYKYFATAGGFFLQAVASSAQDRRRGYLAIDCMRSCYSVLNEELSRLYLDQLKMRKTAVKS